MTYREQIDGQYWFPTYIRADDVLHFNADDIHMREIIKLTNYKRFGSKTRIIYKGEAKEDPKDNPKDNPKTPDKKIFNKPSPVLIPKSHPVQTHGFLFIC